MVIYELPISLYSFKLRLAMILKGMSLEGASVELRAPPGGTYRSDEYRAINPAGTIPALIDGDLTLTETDAIVEYLDDTRTGAALLPSDPKQRARTRMLSRFCDLRLEAAVRSLFPAVKATTRDEILIAAADARIAAAFALFEKTLDDNGPYATGATPGLADCGLTATLCWFDVIKPLLKLSSQPGAKLTRVAAAMQSNAAAMQSNAAVAEPITDYQALVSLWAANS